MKKYVTSNRDLIVFDTDTMDVDTVASCRHAIDWMYVAPDDGVLNDGTPVKKGQIIMLMYGFDKAGLPKLSRKTIVIQDEVFAEHVRKFNELDKAERNCYVSDAPCELNCPA